MLLTDRYAEKTSGVLSCFDRVVIQGTLPKFCFAQDMADFFNYNHIRLCDYPRFAEPLRDELRDNAERVARMLLNPDCKSNGALPESFKAKLRALTGNFQ